MYFMSREDSSPVDSSPLYFINREESSPLDTSPLYYIIREDSSTRSFPSVFYVQGGLPRGTLPLCTLLTGSTLPRRTLSLCMLLTGRTRVHSGLSPSVLCRHSRCLLLIRQSRCLPHTIYSFLYSAQICLRQTMQRSQTLRHPKQTVCM